jgi:hypothetical protein
MSSQKFAKKKEAKKKVEQEHALRLRSNLKKRTLAFQPSLFETYALRARVSEINSVRRGQLRLLRL